MTNNRRVFIAAAAVLLLWAACASIAEAASRKANALLVAAGVGKLDVVQRLLARGFNPNSHDNAGTALGYATLAGHLDVVKALVDHGANVNLANSFGNTPLMLAATEDETDIASYLLQHDASVDAENNWGWTALGFAVSKRNPGGTCKGGTDQQSAMETMLRAKGATRLIDYQGHLKNSRIVFHEFVKRVLAAMPGNFSSVKDAERPSSPSDPDVESWTVKNVPAIYPVEDYCVIYKGPHHHFSYGTLQISRSDADAIFGLLVEALKPQLRPNWQSTSSSDLTDGNKFEVTIPGQDDGISVEEKTYNNSDYFIDFFVSSS